MERVLRRMGRGYVVEAVTPPTTAPISQATESNTEFAEATADPYRPPAAAVTSPSNDMKEFHPPRRVPMANGVRWVVDAWPIFAEQPLRWIGAFILYMLLIVLPGYIPFIGLAVSSVLYPMIVGGLMIMAYRQSQRTDTGIGALFSGFSTQTSALLTLGAIYFVGSFLANAVATALVIIHGAPPLRAAALSFKGCTKNVPPLSL
jgi:hypothetical protein